MVDRRRFLAGLGSLAIGSGALIGSGAFSEVSADRGVSVDVASGSNALVGIVGQGPVQKNQRDPMVEFTNNLSETVSITVALDNCGDGTLYDNEGGSGCSVTLTLDSGNTQTVDLESSVAGTITYSVSANATGFSLDTSGSVDVQTGKVTRAIRIKSPSKDQDFTANVPQNVFEVKAVDIEDDDGDNDLDTIVFEVVESGTGGTVVGSFEVTDPPGDRYKPNGNPAVTIQPDSGVTVTPGTTYKLTVTATDVDGNKVSETVEDTP